MLGVSRPFCFFHPREVGWAVGVRQSVNSAVTQPSCLALAAVHMLRPNADARGGGGKADEPNFSFLVTLLTMLDFSELGKGCD